MADDKASPLLIPLTKLQKRRAEDVAAFLGSPLTTIARLAIMREVELVEEKQRQAEELVEARRAKKRKKFVPAVEQEWDPAPSRTRPRHRGGDPRAGTPLPATIPVETTDDDNA